MNPLFSRISRRRLLTRVGPLGFTGAILAILAPVSHAQELSHKTNMTTSTDITGTWSFDANGSKGSMTIYKVDSQWNLTVDVTFDGLNRKDKWVGVWNDTAKSITLTRSLPNNVTQNYVGYLGDNSPGPIILAGNFTESDIPSSAARTRFGWFAVWQYLIIG